MFLLNIQSKVPIFEQIETQIMRFIETGVLAPGDRLPSVRQLAKDNGINPNTVARAYAQLGNGLGIARLNDVTRGQSPTAQNGFYLPGTDLCEEVVELEVHIQLLQVELVVTMDGA